MQESKRRRGVTLVETCIVLAVIGVLACAALPGLQRLLEGRRLQGAAVQLAGDIQYVRSEATARQRAIRLGLQHGSAGSCYIVHTGGAGECRCLGALPPSCSDGAEPLKAVQLPDGIGLRGNVASILFDPLHGTSTPTGTLRVVAASGREVHHVVNLLGRVRSCSPEASVPGYARC